MKRNIKFTKKDADIVALKNFLLERKFNETVIKILRAAAKDRVAVVPMEFEIVPFEKHPGTKIDLPEDLVRRCESELGFRRGKFTTDIKAEILRCIRHNYQAPPKRCVPFSQVEGVRVLTPHSCRHTYVSQLQGLGVDMETIKSIVGHAEIDMTQHYLHVQEPIRQDAVTRFSDTFVEFENQE